MANIWADLFGVAQRLSIIYIQNLQNAIPNTSEETTHADLGHPNHAGCHLLKVMIR